MAAAADHVFPNAKREGNPRLSQQRARDMEQASSSSEDNSAPLLTDHQKKLLSAFDVAPSLAHQERCLEADGGEDTRQDFQLRTTYDSAAYKTLVDSSSSPTLFQHHPQYHHHPHSFHTQSKMAPSVFDPSKYGASTKKKNTSAGPGSTNQESAHTSWPALPTKTKPLSGVVPISGQKPGLVIDSSASCATRNEQITVLQPKSTNKFTIPGFDPSRYGKPNAKPNRQSVPADVTKAEETASEHTDSVAVAKSTSLPNEIEIPEARVARISVAEFGGVQLPPQESDDDNQDRTSRSFSSTPIETVGDTHKVERATNSQHGSSQAPPASQSSISKNLSKDELLKLVQQAAMKDIGKDIREMNKKKKSNALPVITSVLQRPIKDRFQPPLSATMPDSGNDNGKRDEKKPKASRYTMPTLVPETSTGDLLKQVQEASLREIGMRNRYDGRDMETTSLLDLNLARTPAALGTPGQTTARSSAITPQITRSPSPREQQADLASHDVSRPQEAHSTVAEHGTRKYLTRTRSSKWCTKEELRPELNLDSKSNAWGSQTPSNASAESNDSTKPMQLHGKLFKGPPATEHDEIHALAGWDGKIQPPPVDWNDRPHFNNNSPGYKNMFNNWFDFAASQCYQGADKTPMFTQIPYHTVSNVEWHADGINMVRRDHTLHAHNISRYGYDIEPAEVTKYADIITARDFEDWGKLDLREPNNLKFKDETTELLVQNWLTHYKASKTITPLAAMPGHKTAKKNKASKPEPNPNIPAANIYLRPAVKSDLAQLTNLYNWWVVNSPRTAEVRPIEIGDMQHRFETSKTTDRLPFIVAILKSKRSSPRNSMSGVKQEQVVGFAVATGFTAPDFVEHISAEVEIYVHHAHLRQGIGKCLMDRLMCATDRGHMQRGGYPFHCDPTEQHWYEVGGARNLHKVMFVARQYSRPQKDRLEQETDVTTWLKRWLVNEWDFELEATLKQAGAKNGRFLDLVYFSRFSKWLPDEGCVPDPENRDFRRTSH